jgi:hypothetical protein
MHGRTSGLLSLDCDVSPAEFGQEKYGLLMVSFWKPIFADIAIEYA